MSQPQQKRRNYGPAPKGRVRAMLKALLYAVKPSEPSEAIDEFALQELYRQKLSIKWSSDTTLEVHGTLKLFMDLIKLVQPDEKLFKDHHQIRDVLWYLEQHLQILKHHLARQKGLSKYHFSLRLWSPDIQTNFHQFDQEWEQKRSWKSKVQALPDDQKEWLDAVQAQLMRDDVTVDKLVWAESPHNEQGYSALSSLLKDSPILSERFDKRWQATLGQNPDMKRIMTEWIQSLGEVVPVDEPWPKLWSRLNQLLQQRVLVMWDDVWDKSLLQSLEPQSSLVRVLAIRRTEIGMTGGRSDIAPNKTSVERQTIDWGEAPDINIFFGCETELTKLENLIISQEYRLIGLRGTPGIGKTFLAIKLGKQIQNNFDYVIWKSLDSNLPIENFLTETIKFISHNQETDFSHNVREQLSTLIKYLNKYRCLLILDNWETVIENNSSEVYKAGYGQLLKKIASIKHRSCLIVTSRRELKEAKEIDCKDEEVLGLGKNEAIQTLIQLGLNLDNVEDEIIEHILITYSGNPSMLKFIADDLRPFIRSDINMIRDFSTQAPDEVEKFLLSQFNQLSEMDLSIIYWLAIEGKATTFQELKSDFKLINDRDLILGIKNLTARSLIEENNFQWELDPIFRKLTLHQFSNQVKREFGEILRCQTQAELKEVLKSEKVKYLRSHTLIKDNYQDIDLKNAQRRRIIEYLKYKLNSDNNFLSINIHDQLLIVLSWLSSLTGNIPQKMIGHTITNIKLFTKEG